MLDNSIIRYQTQLVYLKHCDRNMGIVVGSLVINYVLSYVAMGIK